MNKSEIIICPDDRIAKYQAEVDRILSAIDHADALVTDESRLGDFQCWFGDDQDTEAKAYNAGIIDAVTALLGRRVQSSELICTLAEELSQRNQTRH